MSRSCACWGAQEKEFSLLLWVWGFFLPLNLFCLLFFIALKCYFQQLLSYKYLLFFFSSFPPGEKGRGPIENSALSLSGEFKCGSNNRFLLLFFFKFPVVLLPRSALKENRKGRLEYVHLHSQRQAEIARQCVYVSMYKAVYVPIHTHTRAHMYIHGFFPVALSMTQRCPDSKTISETGKKRWEVGKVWEHCSVLNRNINPSKHFPLGIAKALRKRCKIPDSSYNFPWGGGKGAVILQAAMFQ